MTDINHLRNSANHAEYLRRRAATIEGKRFPDPRDQELADIGIVLRWHQRIARRQNPVSLFDADLKLAGLRGTDLMQLAGVSRSTVHRWRYGDPKAVPQYAKSLVSLVNRIRFLASELTRTQELPANDNA